MLALPSEVEISHEKIHKKNLKSLADLQPSQIGLFWILCNQHLCIPIFHLPLLKVIKEIGVLYCCVCNLVVEVGVGYIIIFEKQNYLRMAFIITTLHLNLQFKALTKYPNPPYAPTPTKQKHWYCQTGWIRTVEVNQDTGPEPGETQRQNVSPGWSPASRFTTTVPIHHIWRW